MITSQNDNLGIPQARIMAQLSPQVHNDLDYILREATSAPSVLDELTLLRASLRAYLEGKTAQEAVAWAASQLSGALTKTAAT